MRNKCTRVEESLGSGYRLSQKNVARIVNRHTRIVNVDVHCENVDAKNIDAKCKC